MQDCFYSWPHFYLLWRQSRQWRQWWQRKPWCHWKTFQNLRSITQRESRPQMESFGALWSVITVWTVSKVWTVSSVSSVWKDKKRLGGYLLSRKNAVPSAWERLTSVFGMGTGISTLLWPPSQLSTWIPNPGVRKSIESIPDMFRDAIDNMVKPFGWLVPLDWTHCCACIRGLSTR